MENKKGFGTGIKITSFLLLLVILWSCGKHNPEDPWYPHFKHMNKRLEGEWELVKLYIDGEDSSVYLDIDTMPIARFFKFEPTKEINEVEGEGILYLKSKNMENYPEKVGACPSDWVTVDDSSKKAIVKLTYKFREGSKKGSSYFKYGFTDIEEISAFTPETAVFKPLKFTNIIFNNFYYRPFYSHSIARATKHDFIIQSNFYYNPFDIYSSKKYRYEFKKIK